MATTWIAAGADAEDPYSDIRYEKSAAPTRASPRSRSPGPEVRNAFRPRTIIEISRALEDAREDPAIGVIVLTGEGPTPSARAETSACAATPATSTEDDAGERRGSGAFT